MSEELKRVEAVLDEKVRPSLRSHGGAIEVDRLENRVLYVKPVSYTHLSPGPRGCGRR